MHPHVQKLIIFGLITLFVLSWSIFLLPRRAPLSVNQEEPADETGESAIYNATLGVSIFNPYCPLVIS